ncbi:unnamed protein product [Cladocopium goreaui]|uniref:Uncharacterized protein n=1 Tax=Cladocopium goreaui TaxID=2562237 RepID=A0A9P1FEM1_9DINO|nr:unnamed protein product [Cladocopium goreaui]
MQLCRLRSLPILVARGGFHRVVARPQLRCRSQVANTGNDSVPEQSTSSTNIDVHKKRPVSPLRFEEKTLIFESQVDVKEVILTSRRKCQIGAALSICGFNTFLASLSLHGALSMQLCMAACLGLIANAYIKLATSQRLVARLADRHVERLEVKTETHGSVPSVKEMDAAQKLLLDGASMEDPGWEESSTLRPRSVLLSPRRGFQVKSGTGLWSCLAQRNFHDFTGAPSEASHSQKRAQFLLGGIWADVDSMDEALKYKLDDAAPDAAQKATMAAMCKLGLIDINEASGKCFDVALLSALKTSDKILVDEEVEPRFTDGPLGQESAGWMLSEVTKDEASLATAGGDDMG